MFDDEFNDDSFGSKEEIELYKNNFERTLQDLMEYYNEWLSFNEMKQRETIMKLRHRASDLGDCIFLMNGNDLMEKFQDMSDDEAKKIMSMFADADLPRMAVYFGILYRHKKDDDFKGQVDVDDDDDE